MRSFALLTLLLAACAGVQRREPSSHQANSLEPFTTDGCSSFPDGIPFTDPTKWLHCCVIHDIAYWQGGTAEQRLAADGEIRDCVAKTGEPAIAQAMYVGVRAGGYEGLPTRWRWGYGWVQDRGYAPLTEAEQEQVKALMPENPLSVPVVIPPAVPTRRTLTGDYCLDIAIKDLRGKLGPHFDIVREDREFQESSEGTRLRLYLTVEACAEPAKYEFLLLRPKACTTPMNEALARGRIRLRSAHACERP